MPLALKFVWSLVIALAMMTACCTAQPLCPDTQLVLHAQTRVVCLVQPPAATSLELLSPENCSGGSRQPARFRAVNLFTEQPDSLALWLPQPSQQLFLTALDFEPGYNLSLASHTLLISRAMRKLASFRFAFASDSPGNSGPDAVRVGSLESIRWPGLYVGFSAGVMQLLTRPFNFTFFCGMPTSRLLSRGRPAEFSTINYSPLSASWLVDGNHNGHWSSSSCAETSASDPTPWFMVDLQRDFLIDRVDVYNRQDCCHTRFRQITLGIGSDQQAWATWAPSRFSQVEYYAGPPSLSPQVVPCFRHLNFVGRIVVLQKNVQGLASNQLIMNLCEVEVLGWDAFFLASANAQVTASFSGNLAHAVDANASTFLTLPSSGSMEAAWLSIDLTHRLHLHEAFLRLKAVSPIGVTNFSFYGDGRNGSELLAAATYRGIGDSLRAHLGDGINQQLRLHFHGSAVGLCELQIYAAFVAPSLCGRDVPLEIWAAGSPGVLSQQYGEPGASQIPVAMVTLPATMGANDSGWQHLLLRLRPAMDPSAGTASFESVSHPGWYLSVLAGSNATGLVRISDAVAAVDRQQLIRLASFSLVQPACCRYFQLHQPVNKRLLAARWLLPQDGDTNATTVYLTEVGGGGNFSFEFASSSRREGSIFSDGCTKYEIRCICTTQRYLVDENHSANWRNASSESSVKN